jgi:hypothetical protein
MVTDNQLLKYLGGRKFTVSVLTLLSSSILCWFGKVDASTYSYVVVFTVGAFISGNVWQHINTTKVE